MARSSDDIILPTPHGAPFNACARWLLMLAHLYYDRDVALVDDATYDQLSQDVADVWGEITSPLLRWQLGDPDDIRATGMGFKLTWATVGGAEALWKAVEDEPLRPYEFPRDRFNPDFGVHFAAIRG